MYVESLYLEYKGFKYMGHRIKHKTYMHPYMRVCSILTFPDSPVLEDVFNLCKAHRPHLFGALNQGDIGRCPPNKKKGGKYYPSYYHHSLRVSKDLLRRIGIACLRLFKFIISI